MPIETGFFNIHKVKLQFFLNILYKTMIEGIGYTGYPSQLYDKKGFQINFRSDYVKSCG